MPCVCVSARVCLRFLNVVGVRKWSDRDSASGLEGLAQTGVAQMQEFMRLLCIIATSAKVLYSHYQSNNTHAHECQCVMRN